MCRLLCSQQKLPEIVLGASLRVVSGVHVQQSFATAQGITSDESVCMNTAEKARLRQHEAALLGAEPTEVHAAARVHQR
ncbi:hypothetical protein AYM40_03455 [Paraburkholderia phytofirmans OLGA172]|jgi:hypothetical protein|uniref:Uncharacterized protein n=2 Tax=Burkholderiaceae TaxID=119060 RepID=A0A160FI58_9BURK|nr:hypothetical protein AYM40_03455 [Paraburkholderia phytofirmans OLGA172]